MSRLARLAVLVAGLLLGPATLAGPLAAPAAAATLTQEGSAKGLLGVTVFCPEGQVFTGGEVRFYRSPSGAGPAFTTATLTGASFNSAGQPTTGEAAVPRSARYYRATYTCEPQPATVQIAETVTLAPGAQQLVSCPGGYYLEPVSASNSNPQLSVTNTGTGFLLENLTTTEQTTTVSGTCKLNGT